jgi:hypothetical protein
VFSNEKVTLFGKSKFLSIFLIAVRLNTDKRVPIEAVSSMGCNTNTKFSVNARYLSFFISSIYLNMMSFYFPSK